MKALFITLLIALGGAAYAACTQTVIIRDGQTIICSTCCNAAGANCITTCR